MIGWENDRGAYYIQKLQEQVTSNKDNLDSLSDDVDNLTEDVGDLTELGTTDNDDLVEAINEVLNMAKCTKISNPLTMEQGFTTSELSAYKQGKIAIVNYQFNLANMTANTNTKIGTFADAIKPAETHFFTGLIGAYANSGTPCKFILKTDGSINVSVPSNVGESAVAVRGTFIYVSV